MLYIVQKPLIVYTRMRAWMCFLWRYLGEVATWGDTRPLLQPMPDDIIILFFSLLGSLEEGMSGTNFEKNNDKETNEERRNE